MPRLKLVSPLPILGIDVSKPGEYIAARSTKRSINWMIHRSLIEKRYGTGPAGASLGERVQYLTELDTGLLTFFVRIGQTKFEEFNKTTLAWTNRAHAPLTGTVADQISAATPILSGVRILTYTNGRDLVRKYIGGVNDALLGGSPPICKYLLFYANYLLFLNITVGGTPLPWRVDWTDAGNPENTTTGDAGSTNLLEDSSDITGAGQFGQYFTVHKENAIYVGYLTNTSQVFKFERRETGAGTVANRTILTLPTGEQIFLARDGLRIFNGIVAPLIESLVNDELRDYLNPEFAYKSWGKVVRESDEVWIGVPLGSQTEPETIYKFNYVTRQVHKDTRGGVTAVGDYKNTVGQITWDDLTVTWDGWVGPWDDVTLASLNRVIVFGFEDGATTRQNSGSSDNGTAIESEWDSKDYTGVDYGLDPDLLMRWEEIRIWARGAGSLEVFYTVDGGATYIAAGSITLGSDFPSDFAPQIIYVDVVNVRFGVRFRHATDNQNATIKQAAIVAVQREEVR